MTHPLIEAVARELDCPPDKARAAVLATLRGLREPSEAMGEAFDKWLPGLPLRDAWSRSVEGLIAEIGGPDA